MRTLSPGKARQQVSTQSQKDRHKKGNKGNEKAEENTGIGDDDEAEDENEEAESVLVMLTGNFHLVSQSASMPSW